MNSRKLRIYMLGQEQAYGSFYTSENLNLNRVYNNLPLRVPVM